jgi:hypothetical protein
MFTDKFKKYKKALVFGTGGGNDIISSIIPALHLQKLGIQTDIGGVLSPVANHSFDKKEERPINEINNVKRIVETPYILTGSFHDRFCDSTQIKEIGLVDNFIPDIIKKENLNINKFYNFSFKYGTAKLLRMLNSLIKKENYDLVIGVDVGGDILANGVEHESAISPIMDLSSLFILGNLDVDTYLVEYGLCTDGELTPHSIDIILDELKEKNLIVKESQLKYEDKEVKVLESVYNQIKEFRKGNTNRMTLASLQSDEDIYEDYKFRSRIGDKVWYLDRKVHLPYKYKGKTLLIDAKKFYQERKHVSIGYKRPFEFWEFLKKNYPFWNTEMDYFFVKNEWVINENCNSNVNSFLLTPSTFFDEKVRKEIILYGIQNVRNCIILKQDSHYLLDNDFDFNVKLI